MGSLIKVDKPDFAGKPEAAWALSRDDLPSLVGIQTIDPNEVPDEACQIVRAGTNEILGRITSSRMSPTLGRSICLGQVAAELARPGTRLTVVMTDGRRIDAAVMPHHAHFDPEGTRLRG
jgi:sarcosine oxidase subunit alpha